MNNEIALLYIVAHVACLIKFAYVLKHMHDKFRLEFSLRTYAKRRWLRWVIHYFTVITFVYLLPGSINTLAREGYVMISVALETMGAFAIGFYGYDLLSVLSMVLGLIKKLIVKFIAKK